MTFGNASGSSSGQRARHLPGKLAVPAACLVLLSACTSGGSAGGGFADSGSTVGGDGIETVGQEQRVAAPRLTGETLQGEGIDLGDYKGEVVVLNVWGSWCDPCQAEAPHFVKVAEDLEGKGVQFIGINTRNNSKVAPLKFEQDHGVPYPSIYDPYGELLLEFPKGSLNPQTIPSTLVIDRDGRIAARAMRAVNETQLRKMIEPLMREE